MDEVESEDELPGEQDIRPIVYKALKTLSNLRNDHITKIMLPHRVEEWKQHTKILEELATSWYWYWYW